MNHAKLDAYRVAPKCDTRCAMEAGIKRILLFAFCVGLTPGVSGKTLGADDHYVNSIREFLHSRFDRKTDCMVIGLVDEQGSTTLAAGKLDNGTDQEADGDSLFLIGS